MTSSVISFFEDIDQVGERHGCNLFKKREKMVQDSINKSKPRGRGKRVTPNPSALDLNPLGTSPPPSSSSIGSFNVVQKKPLDSDDTWNSSSEDKDPE